MVFSNLKVDSEKIADDLWILSRNGNFIAFSPLSGLAFKIKPKGVEALYSHFFRESNGPYPI